MWWTLVWSSRRATTPSPAWKPLQSQPSPGQLQSVLDPPTHTCSGKLLETWTRVGHCSEDACTCGRPCCGQAEQLQVAQLAWSPLQLQLSPGHPHSPRTMFTWQGFVERSADCPGLHTLRRFGGDPLAEVLPEVCWTYLNKEAPLQANSEQRTKLECS